MTPSRRQFVATMATVPFLAQASGAQPGASRAPDPVLDEILSTLRELAAEFESQPRDRKARMRAMESTLGVGAAHLAAHYDRDFQASLRRRQSRTGRAALIQDIVNRAYENRNPGVTHEAVDAAMTRLEQRGLSGCFRDARDTIRKVRAQSPEQLQAAAAMQFDYCADLVWMINMLEASVAIACALAILEPTVGGEIACGTLTLVLGLLLVQRMLFC